jgi:hypothetical protein
MRYCSTCGYPAPCGRCEDSDNPSARIEIDWSTSSLPQMGYCHMCDCLIGALHNATEHQPGKYVAHEPFLEDGCWMCQQAAAAGRAV